MLIRTRDTLPESIILNDVKHRSGILDSKRLLYLFYSSVDIENINSPKIKGETYVGKAIMVNMSVSNSYKAVQRMFFHSSAMDSNSVSVDFNTYMFDIIAPNNIKDVQSTVFHLREAFVKNRVNDFDVKSTYENGENFYSRDLRDNGGFLDILNSQMNMNAPIVIDPKFYTSTHMYNELGDMYDLFSLSYALSYEGHELIDENTTTVILDISKWDSMVPEIKDRMYDVRGRVQGYTDMVDLTEISDSMLYQGISRNLISGAVYIIDSDLGINVCNTNSTIVPFRKYEFDNFLQNTIACATEYLQMGVDSISKKFGPTRLLYAPSYQGDKIQAYFKDYSKDNQPTLKGIQTIDKSMPVLNELNELANIEFSEYNEYDEYVY